MKVIIVGATGTIGKHVTRALENEHEIIKVGKQNGDIKADITSTASIESLFKQTGPFDALINVSGDGYFGPWQAMTDKEFRQGIDSKLMGQINLVLIGRNYINKKGSFTLTSGIVSEQPVLGAANLSTVNAAIDGFVRAAAIELEGIRINAVSPGVAEESPQYFPYFPGVIPVAMKLVTAGYLKSVLGGATGQVIKVF